MLDVLLVPLKVHSMAFLSGNLMVILTDSSLDNLWDHLMVLLLGKQMAFLLRVRLEVLMDLRLDDL